MNIAQNITLHVVCLSLCNNRKTKWYRNELFYNHLPPTHSGRATQRHLEADFSCFLLSKVFKNFVKVDVSTDRRFYRQTCQIVQTFLVDY